MNFHGIAGMRGYRGMATLLMAVAMLFASCRYRVHGHDRTATEASTTAPLSPSEASPIPSKGRGAAENSANNPSPLPLEGMGEASGAEVWASMKGSRGQLLRRTGYTTQYNPATRCPDWTAWHLTRAHTEGPVKRKGVDYAEDLQVGEPRATRMDYMQSGYDRGHMCPAGDNKWDRQAMQDCFLYTNMCPQNHDMNGGVWNDLEMKCRDWARKYGDIYIVCGPVYDSAAPARYIGRNKVRVPDGFFKAVLCTRGTPKAIGFYYPNTRGEGSIEDHAMSIDHLERMTGIDFFPTLDIAVQRKVEAAYNFADWQ